jgi:hypothetical protein
MGMFDDLVPAKSGGGMFDDLVPSQPQKPERSWSSVPVEAAGNLLPSAKNFAGAIVEAVTSPVQTVKNLGDVVAGGARNAAEAVLPSGAFEYLDSFAEPQRRAEFDAKADAVGQFYKDRYGSMEGLKNTLATDPVGAAADAATVLYGGGALTPGRAGTAINRAGSAIDPLANAGRVLNAGGTVAKNVLGTTTGAGALPIETAFQAGKRGSETFTDNMRGVADPNDAVAMAERGVQRLREQRSADYQANNPLGTTGNRPDIAMSELNTGPIKEKISESAGMARFQGVTYNPQAERVLNRVESLIRRFEKAPNGKSAVALDKMKQGVYQIARNEPPGSPSAKIAMDVYHEIGRQIRQQVPGYDKAMGDYSKMSDLINEMRRALSLNDKASMDTKTRKLQSVMRNNVNTNYGQRTRLVDELAKTEPELPAALAGQALSSATPRGLQGYGAVATGGMGLSSMNPATLAMLPFFSPRAVGEGAYAAGRVTGTLEDMLQPIMQRTGLNASDAAKYLMFLRLAGETSQQSEVGNE